MPSMLRRASLCLLTCSLKTALASIAALSEYGPSMSRGLDESHDTTTLLRKTSQVLGPDPSRNATGAPEENQQQCWIFMHLQKCGGETIKKMLKDAWGSKFFIYDSMRWKFGDEFLLDFGEKLATGSPWKVMAGGYPEALRRSPSVEASCRFFTMFRHPISRMVSAYFYCQVYPADVACASEIVHARDVDLLTFAKHWSNFAVRQFALSFVPADDVMTYARTPEARALLPETVEDVEKVSGWYLLKMYLERPEVTAAARGASDQPQLEMETTVTTTAQAGDDEEVKEGEEEEVPDARLYYFLEPAQALLSDSYAAVGILEDFNTTLSLFNAALGMPGMDWHHEFEDYGEQNVLSRMKQEKADTLEKAWTDPELKRYMRLDLLLYEHAVDVFHQQARSYGLR